MFAGATAVEAAGRNQEMTLLNHQSWTGDGETGLPFFLGDMNELKGSYELFLREINTKLLFLFSWQLVTVQGRV